MPQERFTIDNFDRGIIKRMDSGDIPYNAAIDSLNIDGDASDGELKGLPVAVTKTLGTTPASPSNLPSNLISGRLFEWIKTKDAKWNLVYADNGYLNIAKDFYGTAPDSHFGATAVATTATSMVVHNEEVRVANGVSTGIPTIPQWVGYCDYGQFGGSVLGWNSLSSVLFQVDPFAFGSDITISATAHSGTKVFDSAKIYYYTLTQVYDGLQESPIASRKTGGGASNYYDASASDADYVAILIQQTVATMPKRVTSIKLYRKEVDKTTGEESLWRLQKVFDTTKTVAYVDRAGSNQSWTGTTDKQITYLDNNTDILDSYESQTDIPETLASSDVYYSLNCHLNNYHFVANCVKTGIPEAAFLMFRSKQYSYDMFDWTADYLKLPTIPTALKAFNGKIWAFDENNIYRINPDGLYIEDITSGIGCLSQRSITITDYGMFWCDYKNAYMYDGQQIIPIGDAVRSDITSTTDWTGYAKSYTIGVQDKCPIVVFHAPKNMVMFIVPYHDPSTGRGRAWFYNVMKKRWDASSYLTECGGTSTGYGAFSGRNGEVYIANGSTLEEVFGGTNKRAWNWTSGALGFDAPSLDKIFYRPIMDSTTVTVTPVITYGKNRATPSSSLTTGEFISGGSYEKGKLLQLKITESTGYNNVVYSLSIILRKLYEL